MIEHVTASLEKIDVDSRQYIILKYGYVSVLQSAPAHLCEKAVDLPNVGTPPSIKLVCAQRTLTRISHMYVAACEYMIESERSFPQPDAQCAWGPHKP